MASFNPRSFTSPDRLKSVSAQHLLTFFAKWQDYFANRGLTLPPQVDDEFPYDELASILMKPDDKVPQDMVDALYYVHETASKEKAEELIDAAERAGLSLEIGEEPSDADIALQIWLHKPDLLRRMHAETVAFTRSRFIYFAGRDGRSRPAPDPTGAQTAEMQEIMDLWFDRKRREKGAGFSLFRGGRRLGSWSAMANRCGEKAVTRKTVAPQSLTTARKSMMSSSMTGNPTSWR
jgi:hypothetical protein